MARVLHHARGGPVMARVRSPTPKLPIAPQLPFTQAWQKGPGDEGPLRCSRGGPVMARVRTPTTKAPHHRAPTPLLPGPGEGAGG